MTSLVCVLSFANIPVEGMRADWMARVMGLPRSRVTAGGTMAAED